jgi:HAD superfamily hydrolase (TIGR01509 family)
MTPTPGLVIFDCDGVLVDSEPISVSVLVDVLGKAGGSIGEEAVYLRFLGMSMSSIGGILRSDYGFDLTDDHIEAIRAELMRRLAAELRPVPGIREALGRLSLPRCVASSSSLERVRLSLDVTGLLALLEPNLYSASMVERGKPEPDLFLHAAHQMGMEPSRCVVVEDSPAGVMAAKRAGMRVLGFAGGSHARKAGLRTALAALSPDALFDDMTRLPDLVAALDRRAEAS